MLDIGSLVLEVTRRCNMRCEHCLRGNAQNRDMGKETVDKLLDNVDSIGSVTFSGGEPTLNLPLIRYFFEQVKTRGISLGSFYIVTNGLVNQMELAMLLLEEYPYMEEQDFCGVALSVDMFHDKLLTPSPLKGLAFYSSEKEHDDYKDDWVQSRGRAEENGIGRPRDLSTHFEFEEENDEAIWVEDMYVSAIGNIYPTCDLSYEEMEELYDEVKIEDAEEYFKGLIAEECCDNSALRIAA